MEIGSNKKAALYTLGCKLNFSETSSISRLFKENGFEIVPFNSSADVYVINTCSVTEQADKKCRQAVKKAIKQSPDAFVAVVGCYSQLKSEEIAKIKGVDIVLGSNEKFNLFSYINHFKKSESPQIHACEINKIEDFAPSYSLNERTRSFLKIQDGCDYFCSYCTIPFARGRSRNQPIKEIVKEAEVIGEKGIKEIILTGVNIGDFGQSTNETFFELIQALDKVQTIERYRISSIEPNLLTNEIIEFVGKSEKFLPHFHIPLQSGCNKILSEMNRKYDRELFAQRIKKINAILPNAGIGVDVIVGFPGESNDDFLETYEFLKQMEITYLHVFSYSERKNTKAAKLSGKISPKVKEERSKKLKELSRNKNLLFCKKNIGNRTNVLFEASEQNDKMFGFTENYIKVETSYNKIQSGKVLNVKLRELNENNIMNIEY